ncbi:hypothetical protein M5J15_14535 [Serratia symbiotica]|uniref:hypothetical protein n=1 Tax=Serratia symbiotica TaxID=138074 RepID=UPI00209155F2|nr:hypothetical protein [Serratia symbiotica]USS95531.1 hypothetical protein M5J15_14535 [Serratia symbiotica]
MSSLTTTYRRSQLRSLPMPGDKTPIDYHYVVRIPGGWEPINQKFRDWSVGDVNQQAVEVHHEQHNRH